MKVQKQSTLTTRYPPRRWGNWKSRVFEMRAGKSPEHGLHSYPSLSEAELYSGSHRNGLGHV